MEKSILLRLNANIYSCFFWINILHITGKAFKVPCEAGWTLSPVSGSCLKASNVKKTWKEARQSCQAEDADLVKILDTKMNNFIVSYNPSILPIFIGMSVDRHYPKWRDENTPASFNYTRFVSKGTGNYLLSTCVITRVSTCVIMLGSGKNEGKWDCVPCSSKHHYYCEKGPDLCPAEWLPSDASGTCIKYFPHRHHFRKARKFCQQHGGDLVTILSSEMNDFINDQRSYSGMWLLIGLNELNDQKEYRWLDYPEKANSTNVFRKTACQKMCSCVASADVPRIGQLWIEVKLRQSFPFICEKYADCKNEKYGMICPAKCSEHCVNGTCHVHSGRCYYGCDPGFNGSRCDIPTDAIPDFKDDLNIFDVLRLVILSLAFFSPGICLIWFCLKKKRPNGEVNEGREEGQGGLFFEEAPRTSFSTKVTETNPE